MTKGNHEVDSGKGAEVDNSVHNTLHSEAYARASAKAQTNVATGDTSNSQEQEVSGNNVEIGGSSYSVKYPRMAPDMAPMITDESRSAGFQITTPIAGFGVIGESMRYRDLQDARTTCDVATNTMAANMSILARFGFVDQARTLAGMTVESSRRCNEAIGGLEINQR